MSTFPQGAFKRYIQSQITANGTTEVTLTVNTLQADSIIIVSLNTVGGNAPAGQPFVTTKNAATNTIGITAFGTDNSPYDVVVLS